MRTIGVVTVARSDYGIYLPVLRRIQADPDLKLVLFVTGMHLAPEFGSTVRMIETDGFEIAERVEMLLASDTPEGIGKSMGIGVMGFAQVFARFRPDILLVLGDRFETITAPLAALPFSIPVAHIHGGELTEGAMDDALRHAITKLSHLHFVSTEVYARRVIQLGEEPWRVTVSGAPSLDNLKQVELLSETALKQRFGLRFEHPPLLVTYHPVSLEYQDTARQFGSLLMALQETNLPIIFTLPNADTASSEIRQQIFRFVEINPRAEIVENFGTQAYFSMMSIATAMVGNSSSGIIEAASFRLPTVNIGIRQRGRIRAANVIDVGYSREEVLNGITQAISPEFRRSLAELKNPYGDGHAAERIIEVLRSVDLGDHLLVKRFHDIHS